MASLRDYQEEVVALARTTNVIMVGSTGIGKTFVSIMLLREQDYSVQRAFVMAPTRQLVTQIHAKILKLTTLKVKAYCGRDVEVWDHLQWENELLLNSVLVCTPEILRNILAKGYITFERINLLVFDECHHAGKRHPYNQIMKDYKTSAAASKPRIFGTTACPTRDCASNMDATLKKITMDANAMGLYAACAPMLHETYPPRVDLMVEKDHVTSLIEAVDGLRTFEYLMTKADYGVATPPEKRTARLAKLVMDCMGVYQNLGPWCLYRYLEIELERQARKASLKCTMAGNMTGLDPQAILALLLCRSKCAEVSFACTPKLQKIVDILRDRLFATPANAMTDEDLVASDEVASLTDEDAADEDEDDVPKTLDDIIMDLSDDDDDDDGMATDAPPPDEKLQCVIFVNRRAECRALTDYLNARFQGESLFGCMLGQASSKDAASYDAPSMTRLLSSFESGETRVMVSTSVSCEGVDFPLCAMVICADPITCPRMFIQVRGRARHADGACFYLTDASAVDDATQFHVLVRQADEIGRLEFGCDKAATLSTQPLSVIASTHRLQYTVTHAAMDATLPSTLTVDATGAVLDLDSAISCLHMFCQSLPQFAKYNLSPIFAFAEMTTPTHQRRFQATLQLPAQLELPPFETPFMTSKTTAKAVAAFRACEALFRRGELDEHLNSVHRRKKLRDLTTIARLAPHSKRPKVGNALY
ncbi:hypothetical protein SPRG_05956 [Saprolegnia parasitica CBS 223.65]|uniref:Uncharacterized protein n=1 Tax=Saprolegnia parasitica (strain CBS 223.65) TaxID=695850 RepID=A0A067CF79_SAPPC|nr:hypothetical protein SPRG_05956 [Saprolegnia parasitica CBS 223.65]KDO29419.1 hypothetical protein SPRG_05956 [Saprolegnia parasitica CBS 223.65]|eukprot:XP_012199921.1 hypothetical protein SPRG_05956 [Saprolegnia parasitica CBS 223.65]